MPRGGKIRKRIAAPDPIYQSRLVTRLINRVMQEGKKAIAQKQVYSALELIKEKTKQEPLEVLTQAIEKVRPSLEVRPRRVGGASYQVPIPVKGDRRESLAIRWLIKAARSRPNKQYHHFYEKLAAEIIDAQEAQGEAVKKKENIHKVAEANRAFAHFRW